MPLPAGYRLTTHWLQCQRHFTTGAKPLEALCIVRQSRGLLDNKTSGFGAFLTAECVRLSSRYSWESQLGPSLRSDTDKFHLRLKSDNTGHFIWRPARASRAENAWARSCRRISAHVACPTCTSRKCCESELTSHAEVTGEENGFCLTRTKGNETEDNGNFRGSF
jgi:hypothetical protein